MRVLSLLLLLACASPCVLGQYTLTAANPASPGGYWTVSGAATGNNPNWTFVEGTTYTVTIGFSNGGHPFAFSASGDNTVATISTIDAGFNVSAAGCSGTGGSGADGWTGNGCVISITPAKGTAGKPLFYRCTYHSYMVGQINVVAAATAAPSSSSSSSTGGSTGNTTVVTASSSSSTGGSTGNTTVVTASSSSSSSTGGSATAAPSSSSSSSAATPAPTGPIINGTVPGPNFRITGVARDASNVPIGYIFTYNGAEYLNPSLTGYPGQTVTFSLEYPANSHPFGFSPFPTNPIEATQAFFPDLANNETANAGCVKPANSTVKVYSPATTGTPCILTQYVDPALAPVGFSFFYRCSIHSLMQGRVTIVAAPTSSSSTGSAGGSTTAPPQKTSSSSTGNTATRVAGAGFAAVVAIIAAIVA